MATMISQEPPDYNGEKPEQTLYEVCKYLKLENEELNFQLQKLQRQIDQLGR